MANNPISESNAVVTVYTGCMECDHEDEFHGVVNKYDDALFFCRNCRKVFTIGDWPDFFSDD